jgi:hypothetical protein
LRRSVLAIAGVIVSVGTRVLLCFVVWRLGRWQSRRIRRRWLRARCASCRG